MASTGGWSLAMKLVSHESRFDRTFIKRLWESPTANTWLSLFTRSLSLVLVLPLVLRQFPAADTAVWFVFSAVLAVQNVLGFGFGPSFARLLSYARAGGVVEDMEDLRESRSIVQLEGVNWRSVDRLYSCMRRVYFGLSLASLVLLGTVGTAAVWRPIGIAGSRIDIWMAWALVVIGSSLSFWNLAYVTYLQGMNYQAHWRRWESLVAVGGILTAFLVLLAGGGLLALVAANQCWVAVNMVVFRTLCRKLDPEHFPKFGRGSWETGVFRMVWASAWKSGLTGIMTYGLVQSTGVIQAQFGSPASIVTYNFTLRISSLISQVVQAPFITKLPELARLRAAGNLSGQIGLIRRGIRITHWSTCAVTVLVALGLHFVVPLLGITTLRFDPLLWALFSTNILFERHGGMLHQIRNLTNQPMEHFGMIGYFVVNIGLMLLLHSRLGIYTYPAAMLGTQVGFAVWFNAAIAYPVIGVRPLAFERALSIPPLITQLVLSTLMVCFWPA
jgi:O-antigen/teichoic acid export membrane protein